MELNALTKVQKYMTPEQKTLTSSFTEFQSNCCSLIWIFCSKKALRRLNNKHESSLHLIHQEYVSNIRSSRPDVFCDFIKKETLAQVFSCEFCEHLFLQNTSGGCFWNIITVLLNVPKYLEFLKREVYKYFNGLSPQIINNIFKFQKDTYNLRNVPLIESQHLSTKQYGLQQSSTVFNKAVRSRMYCLWSY